MNRIRQRNTIIQRLLKYLKWFVIITIIVLSILHILFFYSRITRNEPFFLGDDFMYYPGSKHISPERENSPSIPSFIIDYDFDDAYIIAKQRPEQFAPDWNGWRDVVYPNGYDTTYYWLIVKSDKKVIGPLDSTEFELIRKEYAVSDKLRFKTVQ